VIKGVISAALPDPLSSANHNRNLAKSVLNPVDFCLSLKRSPMAQNRVSNFRHTRWFSRECSSGRSLKQIIHRVSMALDNLVT